MLTNDHRYYTTSAFENQILEWDSTGAFQRAVGRVGEGPGEFSARGGLMLFLDDADSLFVLDGSGKWLVFDPDLTWVREFPDARVGRVSGAVKLLPNSEILYTATVAGGAEDAFLRMTRDGLSRIWVGPPRGASRDIRLASVDADDTHFWVTGPNGATRGLSIQRWSLDGVAGPILFLDVPWLPRNGYGGQLAPGEPALPEYDLIHVDSAGRLWLTVVVRDKRWKEGALRKDQVDERELYDARVLVIDPAATRIIAHYLYDGPPDPLPPFARFFDGTNRSYRVVQDSTGLNRIDIYDLYLTSN